MSMVGFLIVIAIVTSLSLPAVSSAMDGEAPGDAEDCTGDCDCFREPPPCPEMGEKGLPDTSPEGKTGITEESLEY
jgi:hypothetical protein